MLFNSLEFILFFLIILATQFLLKKNNAKKIILLLGSYYFYAYWDWRFLFLIWASTIVDFLVGRALEGEDRTGRRKLYLIISLVVNLGLLGFFKYFNFFVDSLRVALSPLGWDLKNLNLILPVGISFYTFQTLSYTIDIYRRELTPCRRFSDFALFVAFFPQLVAGPIVRAKDFLPQLDHERRMTADRLYRGLVQFTIGLFKKLFIADRLSVFIDAVFENHSYYAPVTIWFAIIAYMIQLYCDFSGYSDMATGVARTLGFDFNRNFNFPFVSKSITGFWRRWHISLSSWLRDYLYIPLGGNRRGKVRLYVNLMITMVLGGLWHGASWNFVIWGFLNGLGLVIHRLWTSDREPKSSPVAVSALKIAATNVLMLFIFVFFRAPTLADSWAMVLKMLLIEREGIFWIHPFVLVALAFLATTHAMGGKGTDFVALLHYKRRYSFFAVSLMWLMVMLFYPRGFQPFVYFQF